jgi:hypothetical protein
VHVFMWAFRWWLSGHWLGRALAFVWWFPALLGGTAVLIQNLGLPNHYGLACGLLIIAAPAGAAWLISGLPVYIRAWRHSSADTKA